MNAPIESTGLSGRSVIVTGGGSGIGRATALRFATAGAKVLLADISAERAKTVADEIAAAGGTVTTVTGDLSDQRVVTHVVETAVNTFGGLDVLVNNAGIMDRMSAVADTSDAEWERVMSVNLTAPFLLTRAAMPHLLVSGNGAIVFRATEASLRGSAAGTAYTVSKHGVVGLTKSIAVMYRDKGVRANAIAPGGTLTDIQVDTDANTHGPAVIGSYSANIGRMASADEQASAIVFLASDAATNINGIILPVDNVWSAC